MPDVRGVPVIDADLVGRGGQWAVARDAVASVRDQGRALWLCGAAGTGKSVLLDQIAGLAASEGMRVLRVAGAEAERDLPFSALHQLIWPLMDEAAEHLPAGRRTVLEHALGLAEGPAVGSYTVSAVTLELLGRAARRRPLTLLVDDLHHLDASSAEVLHFLQRRLSSVPIVMVAAVWDEAVDALDSTGVHLLDLGPLNDAEADAFLRDRHPELSHEARTRLLQEAAGNPLALVELPAQLDQRHRTGLLPLPEHLPLGERLERMFAQRITTLTPSARFALLLCALAGRDGLSIHLVAAAASAAGAEKVEEDLAAAEESGLILIDREVPPHVRFRHPLVRSCLVRVVAGAERRRAHRAWSTVLPEGDVRQVTHRAAATSLPDEAVALALDDAARIVESRGGDAEAAHLLARAAALSTDAAARGRRMATAAYAAVRGGRLALASHLLDEAATHGVPAESRDLLDLTHALVRFHADGDLGTAVGLPPDVLAGPSGAETPAPRAPSLSRQSYHTQSFIDAASAYDDYLRGHWDRCVERSRLGAAASRTRGHAFNEHVFRCQEGCVSAARGEQERLDELVDRLRPWALARGHVFLLHRITGMQAMCALSLGDDEQAYALAASLTPPGRFPGEATQVPLVLLDFVEAAVRTGRFDEARRHVEAGRAARFGEISPHHAVILAAAEAVAAADDDVDAACKAAYAVHGVSRWPFELARVHLHHGAWLRRRGRADEARTHLRAAHALFTTLKASPWTERAAEALEGDAGTSAGRPRPVGSAAALTAQELRIAELAATGLTNREIGARLHLSPRTVASHLYKVFPKLGVTSRAAVERALRPGNDSRMT
ncbi:DNA-binding CsgD family transcriptional regulator/energy-coupling factor transporter ATP-binding protein EcfA2 [Streptomyces sp. V4I23]|uniref:helix-turn-helix transcriptional regulator n=1 Tax=Streptomyces sp. V4I23 TaxID=3042282 RepID=UPI00278AC480|nr:LuxR family transcriptional regulator [Streptomyces sp. V4I23]MDQ1006706.1 DNA-binding CsgD family transcriptional regulator/energy-coupling factor transporter ATP-binding protein EcfA2 [Streptomyces sp. V4I23]